MKKELWKKKQKRNEEEREVRKTINAYIFNVNVIHRMDRKKAVELNLMERFSSMEINAYTSYQTIKD